MDFSERLINFFLISILYVKNAFYKILNFILDIDECAIGEHACEKGCLNVPGGYRCTCPIGYKLNKDRETCSGIYKLSNFSNNKITLINYI